MSQTNLTATDNFCSYNSSAAPFMWLMQAGQYSNVYVYGETGINAAGGTAGSYRRPELINVDSFLSGRDEILSKCNPPIPSLDSVEQEPLKMQDNANVELLVSKHTREKRSAVELSAIDYNRWVPNLPADPQDLRFIIEDFAPQRGGMDTQNYAKLAWKPTVERGAAVNGPPDSFKSMLSPSRACGDYCTEVNGYKPNIIAKPLDGKPPGQDKYPFYGPTSQDVSKIGALSNNCGENMFYGTRYDQGSCGPQPRQRVMVSDFKY